MAAAERTAQEAFICPEKEGTGRRQAQAMSDQCLINTSGLFCWLSGVQRPLIRAGKVMITQFTHLLEFSAQATHEASCAPKWEALCAFAAQKICILPLSILDTRRVVGVDVWVGGQRCGTSAAVAA